MHRELCTVECRESIQLDTKGKTIHNLTDNDPCSARQVPARQPELRSAPSRRRSKKESFVGSPSFAAWAKRKKTKVFIAMPRWRTSRSPQADAYTHLVGESGSGAASAQPGMHLIFEPDGASSPFFQPNSGQRRLNALSLFPAAAAGFKAPSKKKFISGQLRCSLFLISNPGRGLAHGGDPFSGRDLGVSRCAPLSGELWSANCELHRRNVY